jgi:hypothetical protein
LLADDRHPRRHLLADDPVIVNRDTVLVQQLNDEVTVLLRDGVAEVP